MYNIITNTFNVCIFIENLHTGWFLISSDPNKPATNFSVSVIEEETDPVVLAKASRYYHAARRATRRETYTGKQLGDPEKENADKNRTFVVHQKLIRLNIHSKVEGFYFVSNPQKVYPTLLAAIQADPSLKYPLPCTSEQV